jgi:divalent metal cation (Fe/Co/Zn/Cd) transporter
VQATRDLRVRWIGHRLEAELIIAVDGGLSTRSSHALAEAVRHALFHAEPRLVSVTVHVDPVTPDGRDHHRLTAHHTRPA